MTVSEPLVLTGVLRLGCNQRNQFEEEIHVAYASTLPGTY